MSVSLPGSTIIYQQILTFFFSDVWKVIRLLLFKVIQSRSSDIIKFISDYSDIMSETRLGSKCWWEICAHSAEITVPIAIENRYVCAEQRISVVRYI